ncbi:TolC family outer membrane protein [Pontibacterium sp. N1Y112]|uniref:TolC family outer membrane protein n=1 Tax=Pontibacterium sinense TaxID=2781979 RepID=A0A8J7JY29_9GAMM|nr:TolC family outer membrane protein [Pontibacterium sinense]MBE9395939.1 TolC family outer membrane protein [Pontibacterium sinense]
MYKLFLSIAVASILSSPANAASLYELYGETIGSDPRLRIAAQQVEVSSAQLDQAGAQLLPQIRMYSTLSENQREVIQTSNTERYKGEKYSLVAQQKLFDLNAWHNRDRYQHLSDESRLRLEERRMLVSVDLTQRYLAALSQQDAFKLVTAEKDAIEKQLQLLKTRYKHQLSTVTHILEVEARLDGTLANEIAAKGELEIAFEALSELVGYPVPPHLNSLTDNTSLLGETGRLDAWTEKALLNNPNLQALSLKVKSEEAALRQADSGHYPTIDLTLSAQKSDIGFENTQAARTDTYVASLNLTFPLFEGGGTSARKAEKRATLRIAQLEYEEARRNILKETRAAYLNVKSNEAIMAAALKALKSSVKSREAQEKGFKYGTVTVVDVLDAIREQYKFRKDFHQAQYDYINNWVQLLSISGTLTEEHIGRVDNWMTSS